MTSEQRTENYLSDITYVTNSELGFDYLRDNLATESNFSSTGYYYNHHCLSSFSISSSRLLLDIDHLSLQYFWSTEC